MEFGRFVWVVFLVCFSLFCSSTQGYRFNVGGRNGWVVNPSENYNRWAEKNRFLVNDTLYFKYKKGADSVLVVNKDDYFSCNTNNPIQKLDGGDSEFTFDRSGPFFFISGQNGNCQKGQKLIVLVLAVRHHKQPNPPPPTTGSPTPSPQPQPPAASPPKGLAPNSPPATSPSPGTNPPATSPSPWSSSPSPSPSPSTSPGVAPPTNTPTTSPVPAPSSSLTPPTLSPPAPPPEGPASPTPPGTPGVITSPPPGSENSTAPRPSGSPHSVTSASSVLVSWVVVLVSVAVMGSFVH